MSEKPRRGRVYDPELLWRLERQVDSANQHLSKALSMIRKQIAEQEGRTYKPTTLEEAGE